MRHHEASGRPCWSKMCKHVCVCVCVFLLKIARPTFCTRGERMTIMISAASTQKLAGVDSKSCNPGTSNTAVIPPKPIVETV